MRKVKLGDLVTVMNEREDNPSRSKYDRFVGLEHYDSGSISITRWGSTEMLVSAMKVFHRGDILVARRNVYLKRASSVDFDGITSGDSIILHVNDEQYKAIVPFVLNTDSFWDYADQHSDGSMSKRLAPKTMLEYEFTLPDDEEVERLSTLLWAMERTKTAYKNLIAKTDELVKSQFVEMFGDKQSGFKYPCSKVQELTDVCSGGTPDRNNAEYWEGGTVPWVKTTELQNNVINTVDEYITEKGLADSSAKLVPAGTILIAMYGQGKTRGMTAYLGIEASTNQACACILPTEKINMVFMWQYFVNSYNELRNLAKGSNQANLNAGMIKSFPVPVPPIELQKQYSAFVEHADKSKFAAQQALADLTATQKALMRQYLG